jgi:hypothetical protein
VKKKYFDWEYAFEFIWKSVDSEGLWKGDDAALAKEFRVSEDESHTVLGHLSDLGLIEELIPGTYAITKWRERDHADDGEPSF